MAYKIKRFPSKEKEKQADEKYNRIMEQFGSIEAYQEAKSHRKEKVIKEPKIKIKAFKGGGRAYGKNS